MFFFLILIRTWTVSVEVSLAEKRLRSKMPQTRVEKNNTYRKTIQKIPIFVINFF